MSRAKKTLSLIDTIEKTQQYELLDQLTDPEKWEKFQSKDRKRLAQLFLQRGESLIEAKDITGLDSFDLAVKLAPTSKDILYQHAATHISLSHIGGDLELAIKSLEKSIELDPLFVESWCLLGEAYLLLAQKNEDFAGFMKVDEVFQQGYKTIQKQGAPLSPRYFWQWGRALTAVGVFSGEPQDYYQAIKRYKQAVSFGLESGELFFDYGNALVDLATFIGRGEMLQDGIKWYQRAAEMGVPFRSDFAYRLAIAYKTDYMLHQQDSSFEVSKRYFEEAVKVHEEDDVLYQKYGELLVTYGRRHKDCSIVEAAFPKFEKAANLSDHPEEVSVLWAEALMTVGSHKENVEYLKQAYEKLTFAAMLLPDWSKIWYLLGFSLNELGNYFQDQTYFLEAIDKFHQGLALDRTDTRLWWGLANSTFFLGDMQGDISLVEKAVRYYSQVTEFQPQGYPSFWNDWGVALMKIGEWRNEKEYVEAAVERFDQAIKQHLTQSSEETLEIDWIYNLGCALDFLGDLTLDPTFYEQAIQILSKVLVLNPGYPYAKYNLAIALTHLGEQTSDLECFHKAQEIFEEIGREDPEDDFIFNDWGVLLIHYAEIIKDPAHPERAKTLYKMAEEKLLHAQSLGNIHSYYNLACLYSLCHDTKTSLYYLYKASQSGAIPLPNEVSEDDWLDNVRRDAGFQDFLEALKKLDI